MGLFDRIRAVLGGAARGAPLRRAPGYEAPTTDRMPRDSEAQAVLADIAREAIEAGTGWRIKLSASPRWQALKNDPDALQRAVLEVAVAPLPDGPSSWSGNSWQVRDVKRQAAAQLLKRPIVLPAESLAAMFERVDKSNYSLEYAPVPPTALLQAFEYAASQDALPDALRQKLRRLCAKLQARTPQHRLTKYEQGFLDRALALLDPGAAASLPAIPPGAFGSFLTAEIAKLPAAQRAAWEALAAHAVKSGDKSAPSASWRKEAGQLVQAIGTDAFASALTDWLAATVPDPAHPDNSLDLLKGFIWMTPIAADDRLTGAVGRFAEVCFRKVSGIGARSVKLGNAALYALSEMAEEPQAGAELFRLRSAIKYPSARTMLDKRIAALASNSGSSVAALEDAALPDFGLDSEGTVERRLGDISAVLTVSSTGTELAWTNAEGKRLKAAPAAAKRDHKAEFSALNLLAKDIEKARAAQARRLEDSWLEARGWSFSDWRGHYHEHPLRRPLVEALIWQAVDGEREIVFLPTPSGLQDITGAAVTLADAARVTLWHPLHDDPEAVLAWRARIVALELTQPIKQAHREVYVVTEAELATETYSNRFAAHILRQHQFRALCQARDWRYDLMGYWDSHNVPSRTLPALGLRVEYSVEGVEDGQQSPSAVMLHIATDQVRFVRVQDNRSIPLVELDPTVFSELMRDVDLFVGVTSVAADPGWQDGGPDGRFGTYWREWAFGDLGQSAETRKQLIAEIAPRLSIADKLEIGDKALIVQGKRHRYAIHFGSTNIQILPENRYLCIVPDRSPSEADKIRLPFTGDGQLSTILAKAFLLVDETKIEDSTILRQL